MINREEKNSQTQKAEPFFVSAKEGILLSEAELKGLWKTQLLKCM